MIGAIGWAEATKNDCGLLKFAGAWSMATTGLPPDFKEFLRLLHSHDVEYLLVGGYAVGLYGHPRATADLDIWVGISPENARNLVHVLEEFGFRSPELLADLFLQPDRVVRMGIPPVRIEILTTISGVDFASCYARRQPQTLDGVPVDLIGLEDLKTNKKAAGRHQDLSDLEHLP
jgi:hypothetical protein